MAFIIGIHGIKVQTKVTGLKINGKTTSLSLNQTPLRSLIHQQCDCCVSEMTKSVPTSYTIPKQFTKFNIRGFQVIASLTVHPNYFSSTDRYMSSFLRVTKCECVWVCGKMTFHFFTEHFYPKCNLKQWKWCVWGKETTEQ